MKFIDFRNSLALFAISAIGHGTGLANIKTKRSPKYSQEFARVFTIFLCYFNSKDELAKILSVNEEEPHESNAENTN